MAFPICLSLVSLLFFSTSVADSTDLSSNPSTTEIQQACKSTRYPDQCQSQLPSNLSHPQPLQIIQSALSVSYQNLKTATSMVQNILSTSADNQNRTRVAQACLEGLNISDHRAQSAIDALSRFKIKDARAWISAVVGYEYGCWSGLNTVNDTQYTIDTISFINETLLVSTSNALSMMASYDVFGNQTESWTPPKTERDGFWEGSGGGGFPLRGLGFMGGFPSRIASNTTVCKEGKEKCCHDTVQAAVDAAPSGLEGKKFVIHIKEGVYEETVRIGLDKRNLVILGDGIGKTVITGSLNTGLQDIKTYYTATVGE